MKGVNSTGQLVRLWVVCLFAGSIGVSAELEERPIVLEEGTRENRWERASVELGAFFSNFDSGLGFAVGNYDTALIDGEDVFGLPATQTVFRGDALYRIGKTRRHQLDFSYAGYRRSGQATLTDPVDVGGGIIIPAIQIDSVLNFDVIRLGYTYAFYQTDQVRIGGGATAYVLPIEYGLGYSVGETPSALEPQSYLVPAPALALRADFRVWRSLYLTSEFNGIYLDLLGFRGTLFDASVAAEYRFWKHLAVGVGYGGMVVDVLSTSGDPAYPGATSLGQVDVSFHGVSTFLKVTF